jgi:EmrB/QacA subfamily drug resistance transporter
VAPARRRAGDWAILLTLSLGFFMTLLDLTIVNIAIPDMRRDLHASLAEIGWVVNAYVIVLAVLMITAGRLGDLRGRRNLFITGIAVFTLASAASGLAQTGTELIAARVVQGLGAALAMPQTMAIIIATFPRERRGAALGVWGGVAALATIAGPTVGGMLVTWMGWRWIFFVNVPLGLVAIICATAIIPDVRSGKRLPLDLPGVLIASAGLVAITYGLVEGQSSDWGTVWSFVSIPLIVVTGVALLVIFVLVQALRQERRPLLPFTLFRDRSYTLMAGVSVIISVGLVGMALPLTLYLQTVLGFSAIKAGLTMAPASLASGFSAPFAGKLADQGGKYLLIIGFALYATGLISICLVAGPSSHWYDLVPGYVITGLGVGFTMSPMQTIATRNVDRRWPEPRPACSTPPASSARRWAARWCWPSCRTAWPPTSPTSPPCASPSPSRSRSCCWAPYCAPRFASAPVPRWLRRTPRTPNTRPRRSCPLAAGWRWPR